MVYNICTIDSHGMTFITWQDNNIKHNIEKGIHKIYNITTLTYSIHNNSWHSCHDIYDTDSHSMAFFILNDIHDNTSHNIIWHL